MNQENGIVERTHFPLDGLRSSNNQSRLRRSKKIWASLGIFRLFFVGLVFLLILVGSVGTVKILPDNPEGIVPPNGPQISGVIEGNGTQFEGSDSISVIDKEKLEWSEDMRITYTSVPSRHPTIAIDLDGNIYLTWVEGPYYGSGWFDDIYYTKFDGEGNVITPNTRLGFPGWQEDSSIYVDLNNNLHIVWHNWYGPAPGEEMFHRAIDSLGNIGTGTQITSSRGNTDIPLLATDSSNNLHLVYQNEMNDPIGGDANKRRDIFYKKFNWDGTTLTTLVGPIELTTAEGVGYPNVGYVNNLGGMAVDQSGNVHIVWADWRDYDSFNYTEIYYTKLDNVGNTLVDDIRLTSIDGYPSFSPVMSIDSSNNIHIIWVDLRDGRSEIYYTKLDNNGNTLVDDTRLTIDLSGSDGPSVAVDITDNVHVIWHDDRDGNWEIYYTKLDNNGNTLIDDTRVTTALGDSLTNYRHPSIIIGSQNRVHITWQDNRDGNWEIYYKSSEIMVQATIDIDPDIINLKSHKMMRHGRWITAYIELPEGYDVVDINVSTVLLNDTISAKLRPFSIGDHDNDGITDLMVKFDKSNVIDMIKTLNLDLPTDVELTVTGSLTDGTQFKGSDTNRVV